MIDNIYKNSNKRNLIAFSLFFGMISFYIEWATYGYNEISDLFWIYLMILLFWIIFLFRRSKGFVYEPIILSGIVIRIIWKFFNSIIQSRTGHFLRIFTNILYPIELLLNSNGERIFTWFIIFFSVVFSSIATIQLIKNVKHANKFVILFFLGLYILIICSNGLYTRNLCYGINGYYDNFMCFLQEKLGVFLYSWTLITIVSILVIGEYRNFNKNNDFPLIRYIFYEPILILLLINPTRVLGVLALQNIRTFDPFLVYDKIIQLMWIENFSIVFVYYLLLPICYFLITSKNVRNKFILISNSVFNALVWGILHYGINNYDIYHSYNLKDQMFFFVMFIFICLPLIWFIKYPVSTMECDIKRA